MAGKQKFKCAHCGKDVWQYPSQLNGTTVHCSRSCYAETLRKRSPANKGITNHASKPCAQCGQLITGMPSVVDRRKYCSTACLATAFTGTPEKALKNYREEKGCWLWQGTLRAGYGRVKIGGRLQEAHRASYEHHVGPIPEGLVVDHLCRNRSCINPAHLEPVTEMENIRRGEQGSSAAMKKHWATRRAVVNESGGGDG